MVKSYTKLIGIFRGKQAKHNIQILRILYDNGPLTAWEITGKIQKVGKISLHATLNKRLRSLEKKEYLQKAGKKWTLLFKGIIAAILIQKTPKPLSHKWADLVDFFVKYSEQYFNAFADLTVHSQGFSFRPFEEIKKAAYELRTFDDWVALSDYVKGLIQTGVVNFDLITNETLVEVIFSESMQKQIKALRKNSKIKVPTPTSNNDKKEADQ